MYPREVNRYMFEAFVTLFSEADVLFYCLFSIAIILLVAETFIPSFGIVGMGGLLMALGAIVARCVSKKNTTLETVMYVVYIVLLMAVVIGLIKLIQNLDKKEKV